MDRRDFIKAMGATGMVAGAMGMARHARADNAIEWKMVTAWPKNFPGLGTGAEFLAKLINEMSGGRIHVKVYAAGEMVPPFEVFDAVSRGTAQMGHASPLYWAGKSPAAQFFGGVPYGLTGQEINGWLYYGGGMELWRELYAPYGLVPAAVGNSTVQMAGWFNKEINSLADLKGLKMRIAGALGGAVYKRAGATAVSIPGAEIFPALKSGAIDATEWIGPYNDLAFGFYKAAKYYYYPGWQEPGSTLECIINQKALKALPEDLQSIVLNACRVSNEELTSEYTAKDAQALQTLTDKHNVQVKRLPDDVLKKLKEISEDVVAELADKDKKARKIYESYIAFRDQVSAWHDISERAYMNARVL